MTYSLHIELTEFLTAHRTRGNDSEQRILQIAMTPILAFDLGSGADVACTKGLCRSGQQDDAQGTEQNDLCRR